ncbi:hypothetical protein TSAR_001414 [Trichomalopsis sarcophagae]|uniref:Uncharacterized protein n=1 Tax=Trichomalopsis sarcophagae TaxID=543379 RepID=A0A232EHH1_9HYME|nr:hypothetical protein TSAR_001414 [Trichomalopsis sarcophagae]
MHPHGPEMFRGSLPPQEKCILSSSRNEIFTCEIFCFSGIKPHHHISPTYKKYGMASYKCRLRFLTLNLLATTLRSNTPFYLRNRFKLRNTEGPSSKRASALDLCILKFGTETFANSFRVGAAQLWNELPKKIHELHKAKYPLSTFKAHQAARSALVDSRL